MKSMTGYGRDEQLLHGCNIQVEVRSVNQRFFEFSCKTPKNCGYLDDKLKAFFKERISRGKISVNVYMQQVEPRWLYAQYQIFWGYQYINMLR